MALMLLFFDAWLLYIRAYGPNPGHDQEDLFKIMFVVTMKVLGDGIVYLGSLLLLVHLYVRKKCALFRYNYVLIALIIASFGKFLGLAAIVYPLHLETLSVINIFVLTSQAVAVHVLIDDSLLHAFFMIAFSFCVRLLFHLFWNLPFLLV
eukprot:GCRY01004922.1.p1 GENE.GCRY01004922.1~~GCRY01004922.1.p1  ORF type:complete len:150 (+),score=10.93 GCRY01004922.1:194-643(+)